jgi:hypothetical protein
MTDQFFFLCSQEGGMESEKVPQVAEEGGGEAEASSRSLDEGDAAWVEEQNKINGELNRKTVLEHPRLEILPGKEVKVVYQPHTGEVLVVFRDFSKNRELKLNVEEFGYLESQFQRIEQFFKAVEHFGDHHVERALAGPFGNKKEVRRHRATGLLECKIPFPNCDVVKFVAVFQWRPEEKRCAGRADRGNTFRRKIRHERQGVGLFPPVLCQPRQERGPDVEGQPQVL